MNDAKRKVLNMVAEGKVSSDEGDKLLAAMENEKRFSARLLVDPFFRLKAIQGILIGLLVALGGVAVALWGNLRFDGFLDMHILNRVVPLRLAIGDQVVAWLIGALVLWLVALIFARDSRFIDFLAGLGIARAAQTLGGAGIMGLPIDWESVTRLTRNASTINPEGLLPLIPLIIIALAAIIWFMTLLFYAFKHATGLKGATLKRAFILGVIAAEVVSKLALVGWSRLF